MKFLTLLERDHLESRKISYDRVKLARADGNYYAIKFSTTSNAYSQETLKKIF